MKKYILAVMLVALVFLNPGGIYSRDHAEAVAFQINKESPNQLDLAAPVAATDELWTSGGPIGGYVTCLAVAPSDPDVMYTASQGSIFRTADGGATWRWVGDIYMQYGDTPSTTVLATLRDLQIAPDNPDHIYAGTETGIYISQNGGSDWTNTMPGYVFVNSIAVDPTNPKNILIGTGRPYSQSDAETIGIFKSTDGGESWQVKLPQESPGEEELDSVETIIFDTNAPLTVYAGTRKWDDLGGYNGGLRKSTDGGETWSPLKVNSVDHVYALAMTPSGFSPATLYAYAEYLDEDIYASTDQGMT